ncbi:hypothetical protein DE146DRAFT_208949 [Phaeosphaeria sp. MPI-PUGE-AT-0046c]|nr:hypothetical protein DE146DRAFT_208949 [Phaeosphaeria sp. MPI-PUGE-AT-0046c]
MSTEVLPMHLIEPRSSYGFQPDFSMAADMCHLYATSDAWGTIQPTHGFTSAGTHTTFPMPAIALPGGHQSAISAIDSSSNLPVPAHDFYQTSFQAANVIAYNRSGPASSPEPSSRTDEACTISQNNQDVEPPYLDSKIENTRHTENSPEQTRKSSTKKPSKVGRKRKMEDAEPGSERAIYLEKNRKAASKCRGKQRKQQEDLVERARGIQQRNKCLKAEVAMLQHGLRVLMEIAGHHHDCPDSRLAIYLQRGADRLAAGYAPTSATPFSPTSSMYTPLTPTFESSPGDRAASTD